MKKRIIGIITCLILITFTQLGASSPYALPKKKNIKDTVSDNKQTLNKFPSDKFKGVVPQNRGKDKRSSKSSTKKQTPIKSKKFTTNANNLNAASDSSILSADVKTSTVTAVQNGTLILYDKTGPYGWIGELYGIAASNLASHFGSTTGKTVDKYTAGELNNYKCVIYIGSTYDEQLPVEFLDDVLNTSTTQVVWMSHNIWQLANRSTKFEATYGFNPWIYDFSTVNSVTYKGETLERDSLNGCGIMTYSAVDTNKATVVATAQKSDGTTFPWAIRSSNLTYIGEIPFAYIGSNDRYLAFCDMLYDSLDPTTAVSHKALVRLEDVSPDTDPAEFRAIVDYLYSEGIPFSFALIPLYKDPFGTYNNGIAQTLTWKKSKKILNEIKYALSHGGTIVMHGYTHQYETLKNPYSGVTGDDFEFFSAHVDSSDNVIYDGPVPKDSTSWALNRINLGLSELKKAGLPVPKIFEYPHYAGSSTDSKALATKFTTVYHRGLYFSGDLSPEFKSSNKMIGQFFPYKVKDVYGLNVLPENLGNYEPESYNNHPARLPEDLVNTAKKNLVIRNGVASFFFHPYYSASELQKIVKGLKDLGYTFTSVDGI